MKLHKLLFLLIGVLFVQVEAQASQVKLENDSAKKMYQLLTRDFPQAPFLSTDKCYSTWYASEFYGSTKESNGQKVTFVWGNTETTNEQGQREMYSAPKMNGREFIEVLRQESIDFGPSKSIRDLECTLLKGGLPSQCTNQEEENQYICVFSIGRAG